MSQQPLEVVRSTPRKNVPAPRTEDILEQAHTLGFKAPSPELVTDLCHIATGGVVHDDVQIEEDLQDARRKVLPFYSLARYGLTRDKEFPRLLVWNLALAELLRQIKPQHVPGRTDEERALSLTSLAPTAQEELDKGKSPKTLAEQLKSAFDAVDNLEEPELDLLGGLPHPVGVLDKNRQAQKQYQGGDGSLAGSPQVDSETLSAPPEDVPSQESSIDDSELGALENEDEILPGKLDYFVADPACSNYDLLSHSLKKAEIARRLIEDKNLARLLDIARVLKDFVRLNVRRTIREVPDREGPDLRTRPIATFSELPRVQPSEWVIRDESQLLFLSRLALSSMQVRERTRRETRKQLLYALLDCSASMRLGDSRYKLGGVMMNRLAAVTQGDAVLLYRFFGVKLYEEHRASTPEESRYALRHVLSCTFPDEDTKLSPAIRGTLKRIKEVRKEEKLERPHLLVLTDGSVSANITPQELGDVVLHLVLIDKVGNYDQLLQLAKLSGGAVIESF